mmetsp:Transcript_4109/g.8808  ORF Transcript_4109/g.8808 Transcript_4109/m.8808 type:complete len:251 (-) Transcript_4109:571-1323(-)
MKMKPSSIDSREHISSQRLLVGRGRVSSGEHGQRRRPEDAVRLGHGRAALPNVLRLGGGRVGGHEDARRVWDVEGLDVVGARVVDAAVVDEHALAVGGARVRRAKLELVPDGGGLHPRVVLGSERHDRLQADPPVLHFVQRVGAPAGAAQLLLQRGRPRGRHARRELAHLHRVLHRAEIREHHAIWVELKDTVVDGPLAAGRVKVLVLLLHAPPLRQAAHELRVRNEIDPIQPQPRSEHEHRAPRPTVLS